MQSNNLVENISNRKEDLYKSDSNESSAINEDTDARNSPLSGTTYLAINNKESDIDASKMAEQDHEHSTTTTIAAPSKDKEGPSIIEAKRKENETICTNCSTNKTPLWRRDFDGNVLCNACGLFLKLHGTARPIKLKSDVIKTRNRKGHNLTHFTLPNTLNSNYITNLAKVNASKVSKLQMRINRDIPVIMSSPAIANFKKMRRLSDPSQVIKENTVDGESYCNIIDATKFMKPALKPKPSSRNCNGAMSPINNKKMVMLNEEFAIEGSPSMVDIGIENGRKFGMESDDSDVDPVETKYGYTDEEINTILSNHEELIKLKIRIKELELITDLYKGYIKRLNGKCNTLELRLQSRDSNVAI
ncbi:hypothetical protein C6P45_005481 [Maudiozyma exigua]|uniref:GATA-type domain-containing protein n=1 Tax=Maudiozyma exigua TaxID=34358 RepID=A0A9P7BAM1_MAUEX|nr:hypothetical protein C6P45_005481 [Kazachstania exigua]